MTHLANNHVNIKKKSDHLYISVILLRTKEHCVWIENLNKALAEILKVPICIG